MELSMEDIKGIVKDKPPEPLNVIEEYGWGELTPLCTSYLAKFHSLGAYNRYPEKFYYDKIKGRLVFVEYSGTNKAALATGRSMSGGVIPKWWKYVALTGTYFTMPCVNESDTVVIVEDCLSACAVSNVANAVALCGTVYDISSLIKTIEPHKKVIVCLDPDAQIKAMSLQRDLLGAGNFISVRIVRCNDDPKYISAETLDKLFYGEKND